MLATAAAITTTARLLTPIIQDLYKGAKRQGARGLFKWDATTFPKKLARRIRVIEEVKTLWSPDKEVSLIDFYHPPKIQIGSEVKSISKIFDFNSQNFVIEGIVGQGKSILLRSLAINEILSNNATRIPIFIELRTLSNKLSLQQAVSKQFYNYDIDLDDESLDYILKSGKLCYLLDGFDELDESLTKETILELESLSEKYPNLQIIITSRPNNEIQKSTNFNRAKILPLQQSDYTPFLTKLKLSSIKIALIKEAIKNSPSKISGIIITPLMLTLVVLVYESDKEIPETLPEFFEKLFQVVFTRHDKLKLAFERKHYSGLSERRLQQLFEAFCFMAIQNGFTRSLSTLQFNQSFDIALEYADNCSCEVENFKLNITKVSCLMLEEGLDVTTFLHKSIMEYYAAAFIKHSSEEVAELFYKETVSDSRQWWEVLSFLKDIDPYRYSKYFALAEYEAIDKDLLSQLSNRSHDLLLKLLTKFYPDLYVGILESTSDSNTFDTHYFGNFSKAKFLCLKDLDQLLIAMLVASTPDPIRRNDIAHIFNDKIPMTVDLKGYIRLPLKALIEINGENSFWNALDTFSRRMHEKKAAAQLIINSNDKRKFIFSKKNKSLG